MATPRRTYEDWEWWAGAGAQSAARKDFDDLEAEGRAALAVVMRKWLQGATTRSECELIEKDLYELKTRVGSNHYRVLFSIRGRVCWVLTAFYKNQQQTPESDKKRARKRRKTLPKA